MSSTRHNDPGAFVMRIISENSFMATLACRTLRRHRPQGTAFAGFSWMHYGDLMAKVGFALNLPPDAFQLSWIDENRLAHRVRDISTLEVAMSYQWHAGRPAAEFSVVECLNEEDWEPTEDSVDEGDTDAFGGDRNKGGVYRKEGGKGASHGGKENYLPLPVERSSAAQQPLSPEAGNPGTQQPPPPPPRTPSPARAQHQPDEASSQTKKRRILVLDSQESPHTSLGTSAASSPRPSNRVSGGNHSQESPLASASTVLGKRPSSSGNPSEGRSSQRSRGK